MAKRAVVWTETAARQRREILKYWVKRNGTTTYAQKLIKLTAKQIKVIQSNPKLFKKANFPKCCDDNKVRIEFVKYTEVS